MEFRVLSRDSWPPEVGKNVVYLKVDYWNDYSFITMFHMSLHDDQSQLHDIGAIKIGFKGQTTETATYIKLPNNFETIENEFFSLGQGVEFYHKIGSLPKPTGAKILASLRDITSSPELIEEIKEEEVFGTSFLRDVSLSVIKGQYARVLEGKAELTDFNLRFVRADTERLGSLDLIFNVKVNSTPSTNIHAIIGRNGVGKTKLLEGMIHAITDRERASTKFIDMEGWQENEISDDYFSSLVSVSFSAFDPFVPPNDQPDPAKGTCYFYVGLKDSEDRERLRTLSELRVDCVEALIKCFHDPKKTERWTNSIVKLGSDENFASMKLERLEAFFRDLRKQITDEEQSDSSLFQERYLEKVSPFLRRMSSGHALVLLTITRLVATVEEKTLVLIDEPESHLHPPLLSAFVRSLAELLHDRNGVAIVATHSPVVLQEIPRSCAWKIYRVGADISTSQPTIETFGENVGVITSEVFKLEVERSGFHDLLTKSTETGKDYKEIVAEYDNQLGFEARAILRALIADRERSSSNDAID